jgi:TRAP transporter TAXI family solute receptor
VPGRLLRLALALILPGCGAHYPPERDLLLATATTGGTYYPAGVAIATLVTRELGVRDQIYLSAITSSGSAENISLLDGDEVQLAIIQALFGSMAWQGTGYYEGRPVPSLRSLASLWANVEQVVVLAHLAPTGTVADLTQLQSRRFSVGPKWSGTEVSATTLMRLLGFAPDRDFALAHLGYSPSVDALQNGNIAGMFIAGGIPTGAITRAMASMGPGRLTLLEITGDQWDVIRSAYPIWTRFEIPIGTYPGQARAIQTIAQPNLLVTTSRASEEVIYRVVKTLFSRLESLHKMQAATRSMSLSGALEGLPVPLHPGAARFYREQGLRIPETLTPPEWRP